MKFILLINVKMPAHNVKMPTLVDILTFMFTGQVALSLRCLAADPGVSSGISAGSHTFVEIDHEIISMVILLPSTE